MKSKKSITKKVKNTKYAFGGSVQDPIWDYLNIQRQRGSNMPNQIESPDTALADNDIRLAKAAQKAENNPWTQGLDMVGNLAMQVGSSMMSQGMSKGQGVSKGGFNWGGLLQQGIGAMGTMANSSHAMGGIAGDIIDWESILNMYPGFFKGQEKKLNNTLDLTTKGDTSMYATGGKVPINAEGEEVIETPQGQVAELQGPSHAEGGIDLEVPQGTEIYSKRLKGPDGKSMADRKKAREKQISKLEKLAKENPTDKTIKKTLDKTKRDFQIQEQQDMQKMQMVHQMSQMQQAMEHFASGGRASPLPVFNWMKRNKMFDNGFITKKSKNIPTKHDIVSFFNYNDDYGDPDGNKHPYGAAPTNNEDGIITLSDADLEGKDTYGPMPKLNAGKSVAAMKGYYSDDEIADMGDDPNAKAGATGNKFGFLNKIFGEGGGYAYGTTYPQTEEEYYLSKVPLLNSPMIGSGTTPAPSYKRSLPLYERSDEIYQGKVDETPASGTSNSSEENKKWYSELFGNNALTVGDMIGLGGQLYSTFAPMKNTQANRAGDTPNVNAFKDYGKDALHKMDQSKQYVNQVRDENLKDLELARTGQISRNRNSARGLNTQRALDLTTDAGINNIKSQIFSQFAQAMQQILSQESQMENQQDQMVMQGEQARDLADRHDRDAYFAQMAEDIATKGTGLQHIGKNINEVKGRGAKQKELDKQFKELLKSGEISAETIKNLRSAGFDDEAMAMIFSGLINKSKSKSG